MNRKQMVMLALGIGLVLVSTFVLSFHVLAQGQEVTFYNFLSVTTEMTTQQVFTPTWATERVDAEKTFGTPVNLVLDTNGHPHIVYGGDHLYYAWYNGSVWHRETVDPAWGVGRRPSIALDSYGNPHISYYDNINKDLKYAHYDEGRWQIEVIDNDVNIYDSYSALALDENNHPHISYVSENWDVRHAYYDGSIWHIEVVGNSGEGETSIRLDKTGHPHIIYRRDGLVYAHKVGSAWVTETIQSGVVVGHYSSLVLDNNEYPHVSYLGNYWMMYAHWTGTAWVTETVEYVGPWYVSNSIALNTADEPCIAYNRATDGWLRYACRTSNGWTIETVDNSDWLWGVSLDLDSGGAPHIGYIGRASQDLHYAHKGGGAWNLQTVDEGADWGQFVSLDLAPTMPYTPHISYAGDALRYAYYDGRKWSIQTVDDVYVCGGTALALAQTTPYTAYIAYYDCNNGNVKFARWTPGGWSTEIIEHVGTTGYGIALELAPTPPYTPHLAYIAAGNLKHAYWTGSNWVTEIVDYGYPDPFEQLDSPSLALTRLAPHIPHISYHDRYYGDLRYASKIAGSWITETLAYVGQGGGYTSLVLDALSNPHIAYSGGYLNAVKYTFRSNGVWTTETVETGRYYDVSLALDANNRPHISYYGSQSGLQYTYRNSYNTWISRTIEAGSLVGIYHALALDGGSRPRIAYSDDVNGDLKFAWRERVDVVPVSGGIVGAYGSANFDFPAGTFTDTIVFTYTVLQPAGVLPHIGVFFDINAVYASTGNAAQIVPGQTYTVVVHYDEANVPSDIDEAELSLYYWDNLYSGWVKEPTSIVDTVNNTITATPGHFSVWAGLFELPTSVTKSVTPTGQVRYGDQLTYTVVISGMPGTTVSVYDPLTDTVFLRFVEKPAGIEYADHAITGTMTIGAMGRMVISFVTQVNVPGTVGIYVDVNNTACVYPAGQTISACEWSNTVTNQAYRPRTVFLPLVVRDQ